MNCSGVLDGLDEFGQGVFRVAVEHAGDGFEEERVLQAAEAAAGAALEDDDELGAEVHFEDRHAGNRALRVIAALGLTTSFAPMTTATSV